MAGLEDHDAQYWMSGPGPADVDAARELLLRHAKFREVRDQALAGLAAEGLSVVAVTVESLLAVKVMAVAAQMGFSARQALAYLKPDSVIEAIRLEADSSHAHAVRPARVAGRRAVPVAVAGQFVAALGQVAKFAAANDEARIADHAADLPATLKWVRAATGAEGGSPPGSGPADSAPAARLGDPPRSPRSST